MSHDAFEQEQRFREAWEAVGIARSNPYSLFTFGESELPYFIVLGTGPDRGPVSIAQGEVRITRPKIITPYNAEPEFRNFFEDAEGEQLARFLLARTAAFSHLQFFNESGPQREIDATMNQAVDMLRRKLDAEEEDRVAILTAPPHLAGVAILRYAAEKVWESAPGNLQELRERGLLP